MTIKIQGLFHQTLGRLARFVLCLKLHSSYRDRSCENVPIISLYKLFQVWRTSNNNTKLPSASHHQHQPGKNTFSSICLLNLKQSHTGSSNPTPPETRQSAISGPNIRVFHSFVLFKKLFSSVFSSLDRKKRVKF